VKIDVRRSLTARLSRRHRRGGVVGRVRSSQPTSAELLLSARRIVTVHQAEMDGLCGGCLTYTARLARWPCPLVVGAHPTIANGAQAGEGR
jgi:hypothetical protein